MNEIIEKIENYNKKIDLLERNKTKLETELEITKKEAINKKNEILKLTEVETMEDAKSKVQLLKEQIKKDEEKIENQINEFFKKYNELVG